MIVKAWNNGKHDPNGDGYGLKISLADRDLFFRREWPHILLYIEEEVVPIKINTRKKSFWDKTCRELISNKIGSWFIRNNFAPWKKGHPPTFLLNLIESNRFKLERM